MGVRPGWGVRAGRWAGQLAVPGFGVRSQVDWWLWGWVRPGHTDGMIGEAMGWRVLARRQWPLALALGLLLAGDLVSVKGLPMSYPLLAVPGAVAVMGLAVVAPR